VAKVRTWVAVFIMTGAAGALQADMLSLDDGTRLVGTIEQITATDVKLSNTFAGELSVPRSKVVGVSTEAAVTVQLNDDA
jgi:hypothetical protein